MPEVKRGHKKALVLPLFFYLMVKINMSDNRATCWSITINNPTKSDDENIALAKQKSGWALYGQKEVGENGTEHYQLMLTTPQVRFSAIKKAFPRSHIEVARDRKALTKYVNKEDTRIGVLPTDSRYLSIQTLWDMFAEWVHDKGSWWNWNCDKSLEQFDLFIGDKIQEGFVVETMAVNPQIRSCVKNYFVPIIYRSNVRRQTDRQTEETIVEVDNINANETDETSSQSSDNTETSINSSVSESSCEESCIRRTRR